ncbi:hypothetical protein E1B28_001640 [Marasmius oreades]|uniref:Uncharacterized protein n=1 Tax=Marasmius oreades TaxID=181124 RepID=A0A9P7V463_9AGAR|nr:uncharacterized protein E1B28_001640 [Marasmius oreades]KAG7099832.1 hypothetical protein E1B28_001640 [Marasmius oreades]
MSLPLGKVIAEYEPRHTELVHAISDVEYASEALTALYSKIAELQTQVQAAKARFKKASERVKKREKQAEDSEKSFKFSFLRRSNTTKGKEKQNAGTQIQTPAYLEAVQEESKERNRQTELEEALASAQNERATLQEKVKECDALKIKLDALYDLIFNGPTPGFPEEDQLEQQVSAAKAVYDRVHANFNTEKQAYANIYRAEKIIGECRYKLKDALQCASTVMFASGHSVQEKETACLESAHDLALQVMSIIQEARRLSPDIRPLENLSIIQEVPSRAESGSADDFYAKLKSASSEVSRARTQLSTERTNYAGRAAVTKSVVEGAEQTLAQYKDELRSLRKGIFENVAEKSRQQSPLRTNGMHGIQEDDEDHYIEAPPPSYDYEPSSTFVSTLSPSTLIIPNKFVRQLPTPYSDDTSSPVSSSSHIWPASPASPTASIRRIRPLPRPPGT